MLILPPIELCDYIKLENGTVVAIKEIPIELQPVYEEFKRKFEAAYQKKAPKI